MSPAQPPSNTDPVDPRIGVDEWVKRSERQDDEPVAPTARAYRLLAGVPIGLVFAAFVLACACLPLVVSSDYVVRVGINTIIFAILALGLNIEVGWVGALDLGYVALFGLGAYLYTFTASDQFHTHWPSALSVPLVVIATAIVAVLVGLSARRLVGDYYAIVTLFFAEAFIVVATNADRITPPFANGPINFTGGPNGILNVDPISVFGIRLGSVREEFYVALVVFAVVGVAIYLVNQSRIGRSWRAMKDDPLAAEAMGIPTNRLRLIALAFGGAIAALAGTTFATVQQGVFPANFDIALLITLYAMVIFGGAGSMMGVIAGVVALNVTLEFLRNPDQARVLFYIVVIASVLRFVRPWRISLSIIGATVALGFVIREIVERVSPEQITTTPPGSGRIVHAVDHWVVVLQSPVTLGNVGYVILLVAAVALTRIGRLGRLLLLPGTLYLAAFVWENRLADNPGVTRLIILGAILVTFMNVRPRGLFGTTQVEIA